MGQRMVQILLRWCAKFTGLALALHLVACGVVTQSEKPLTISLQLPPESDPELFWYDVSSRTLRVHSEKKGDTEIAWNTGGRVEADLREGDRVYFVGADEQGRVRVEGSADVGPEKKVNIPVHRAL